jgi:hypothetical protein
MIFRFKTKYFLLLAFYFVHIIAMYRIKANYSPIFNSDLGIIIR